MAYNTVAPRQVPTWWSHQFSQILSCIVFRTQSTTRKSPFTNNAPYTENKQPRETVTPTPQPPAPHGPSQIKISMCVSLRLSRSFFLSFSLSLSAPALLYQKKATSLSFSCPLFETLRPRPVAQRDGDENPYYLFYLLNSLYCICRCGPCVVTSCCCFFTLIRRKTKLHMSNKSHHITTQIHNAIFFARQLREQNRTTTRRDSGRHLIIYLRCKVTCFWSTKVLFLFLFVIHSWCPLKFGVGVTGTGWGYWLGCRYSHKKTLSLFCVFL